MFHLLLAHQFENRKGYKRVVDGEYVLEEACTSRDLDTSLPLMASVRRGMKINMSIIFELDIFIKSACPRCERSCVATKNVPVQWWVQFIPDNADHWERCRVDISYSLYYLLLTSKHLHGLARMRSARCGSE